MYCVRPNVPSGIVIATVLSLLGVSSSAAGGAQCFEAALARVKDSPAFKINCRSAADCEFEPSQAMNASAMALIDDIAKKMLVCWKDAGLKTVTELESPAKMKMRIRRYSNDGEGAPKEVCAMAELKPFGTVQLTTSFRAQCVND